MKIFLSWHGQRSRAIAEALNDWLRRVIQAVKPFYSPDIEKGAKWSSEIDSALEGTRFGIICLTPDNLDSTWIHYEAGALSKTKDALIWTFLHELTAGDVPQPLGKSQHTIAEKPYGDKG
jgi:TIR domain-containing protein